MSAIVSGSSGNKKGLAATFLGFAILWLALHHMASGLGSLRGEYGIVICLAVLALAIAFETATASGSPRETLRALGLSTPRGGTLVLALIFCVALLCFIPLYSHATGVSFSLRPDAALLAIGIFAQGGIAEEIVFRGFLFRRLRERRSFWRAASIATIPFVAVHALLFLTLEPVVAAAALLVSLSMSFPLAWLFERSGNSIWTCALVHAVAQGAIKLVEMDDPHFLRLALAWMMIAATAPWAFMLLHSKRLSDLGELS